MLMKNMLKIIADGAYMVAYNAINSVSRFTLYQPNLNDYKDIKKAHI